MPVYTCVITIIDVLSCRSGWGGLHVQSLRQQNQRTLGLRELIDHHMNYV